MDGWWAWCGAAVVPVSVSSILSLHWCPGLLVAVVGLVGRRLSITQKNGTLQPYSTSNGTFCTFFCALLRQSVMRGAEQPLGHLALAGCCRARFKRLPAITRHAPPLTSSQPAKRCTDWCGNLTVAGALILSLLRPCCYVVITCGFDCHACVQ